MQSDYEWDFNMPYDTETGDVWDTDTYVAKGDEQSWQTDADMYNKEAEKIWATWGVPNEDGQTTLDIMESKKCSRKCGSKKSESDYGAFDWTVGVSYLENDTGESVKDVYLIKAHNMNSAKEQAILRANRKGSDAHVYSCKLGKHIYGEAKKPACSMQKKKESLSAKKSKKCEGLMDDLPYDAPVAIESLCAEIMNHSEEFTIEDADVAEMCGKWYIRDYANGPTAAQNEDEFVDEVLAGLSGSPVDGSPFTADDALEYAREIWGMPE